LSWFDDTHAPYPSQRSLIQLVEYARELGTAPPLINLDAAVGPGLAADRVAAAGALSETQRAKLLRSLYESSLARAAYKSLERFEEAVERELRSRRWRRTDVERSVSASKGGLSKRPQAQRELGPRWTVVVAFARSVLPPEVRSRLMDPPPVAVAWTRRVVTSTWGHWSIRLRGRNTGRQTIRVNRLLRTRVSIAPDGLLEYILYHELLHHLLPGEGHDAEFNELEALWPDRDELDLALATFHEKWDTSPARYMSELAR
jgi:hypothetical protein